jgi:Arf-GAP with SH3 domain, ANK repeat and PH domain-containing protein
VRREKSAFDHINTEWNLPPDDGSTDFSDDDTMIDERGVSFLFKYAS